MKAKETINGSFPFHKRHCPELPTAQYVRVMGDTRCCRTGKIRHRDLARTPRPDRFTARERVAAPFDRHTRSAREHRAGVQSFAPNRKPTPRRERREPTDHPGTGRDREEPLRREPSRFRTCAGQRELHHVHRCGYCTQASAHHKQLSVDSDQKSAYCSMRRRHRCIEALGGNPADSSIGAGWGPPREKDSMRSTEASPSTSSAALPRRLPALGSGLTRRTRGRTCAPT